MKENMKENIKNNSINKDPILENENKKEEFIKFLKMELNYSNNTIDSYIRDIEQFESLVNTNFENVNQNLVNKYVEYLSNNFKVSTHSRKISSLKKFYKYLNTNYNITNIFLVVKNPKKELKIPTYLSEDKLYELLNSIPIKRNIDIRDKAMFEVLYASGMRVSEILNLEVDKLKLSENFILVIGKGNKERLIPISDIAIYHLKTYLKIREEFIKDKTDVLFLNSQGKKLSRQGFDKILKKRALNVGIESISAHKFRHSIATHLLNRGADLKMIQTFLGHQNISTTEIYTHVSKKKLQEEYEKYLDLDI